MNKLLVASFLLLSACGKFEANKNYSVDPAFVPYLGLYTYYKGRGLDYQISMNFSDLPGDMAGVCTRFDNGYRRILIDKEYWNASVESLRISLIAHELGHCDLNRGHSNDPYSIMYEYNIGADNWYELFHPVGIDHKATCNHETISE